LEIGWWSASHGLVSDNCQSDHQDYLAWKRSKSPLIVFLGITTTIILDLLLSYAFYILGV